MTQTFPIVPGNVRLPWVLLPMLTILVVAGALLLSSLRGISNARFEVSPDGLRLRGDLYGRLVPARSLRLEGARAVNLNVETALSPKIRTMGTALPGYRAGWFRLRNGEKALLYLTDPTRVAYVPTTEGYAVLVSVADPNEFLMSLRRLAAGG